MSNTHTPGPWHTGTVENRMVADHLGNPVADCRALSDVAPSQIPECEANARLIAAAPELLDALEALLNYDNLGAYGRSNVRQQARAAIAKARGE